MYEITAANVARYQLNKILLPLSFAISTAVSYTHLTLPTKA